MNDFFDELKDAIENCRMEEKLPHRWVDNYELVGSTIDIIDSLGENAKRMLEIGILQDELVTLGFKFGVLTLSTMNLDCKDKSKFISVYFDNNNILIDSSVASVIYENKYLEGWQQDVLAKVKELINV